MCSCHCPNTANDNHALGFLLPSGVDRPYHSYRGFGISGERARDPIGPRSATVLRFVLTSLQDASSIFHTSQGSPVRRISFILALRPMMDLLVALGIFGHEASCETNYVSPSISGAKCTNSCIYAPLRQMTHPNPHRRLNGSFHI
jgi:hypothetical protein